MGFWKHLKERTINVEVSSFAVYSNLVLFFGSLSITAYLSGITYAKSYCSKFGVDPSSMGSPLEAAFNLLISVLSSTWYYILVLLIALTFAALFFIITNVFRSFVGFLSLCILVLFSIIAGMILGNDIGCKQAEKHLLGTGLPKISVILKNDSALKGTNTEIISFTATDVRILFEDDNSIIVFIPKNSNDDQSTTQVIRVWNSEFSSIKYDVGG